MSLCHFCENARVFFFFHFVCDQMPQKAFPLASHRSPDVQLSSDRMHTCDNSDLYSDQPLSFCAWMHPHKRSFLSHKLRIFWLRTPVSSRTRDMGRSTLFMAMASDCVRARVLTRVDRCQHMPHSCTSLMLVVYVFCVWQVDGQALTFDAFEDSFGECEGLWSDFFERLLRVSPPPHPFSLTISIAPSLIA